MLMNIPLALVIVATSVIAAVIALALITCLISRRHPAANLAQIEPALEETVFLFDDQILVDATAPARALLDGLPVRGSDWSRLAAFLTPRFSQFESRMAALVDEGSIDLIGSGDAPLTVRAEIVGRLARITVIDPSAEGRGVLLDSLSHRAMEDEIDSLRKTIDAAPILVWRQDKDGSVIWANRTYLLQSGALEGDDGLTWPLPALFGPAPPAAPGAAPRRAKIERGDAEKPNWFECHSAPQSDDCMHFAVPADAAVRAEVSLREFVQTLTKTFAHLPIGLAVFDRHRRLQLFNPALIDLTTLGAEFLSSRPTLLAMLDRLRDARMMPEPKDYRTWRKQMAELEHAAANGLFEETWHLPSGQTYRVTGRPHPEGAVAFLIEDVSAEVALTRRYRSELELSQTVIDAMDEAIAVFSPAGALILSNAAYTRLWGADPGATLGVVGIGDAMKIWQAECRPDPIWADARDFVTEYGDRSAWSAASAMRNGRTLSCRFVPLSGGSTLVGFRLADEPSIRRTRPRTAKPARVVSAA